jgi:hypothetical protein
MFCRRFALCAACVVLSAMLGCGRRANDPSPRAGVSGAADGSEEPVELTIAQGLQFKNLTIFPVVSSVPHDEDRFITLEEGIRDQTVKVTEMGPGNGMARGAVNQRAVSDGRLVYADPFAEDESSNLAAQAPSEPDAGEAANQDIGVDPFACPSVNGVLVWNKSNRPLYLMPGETIVGGQQDRTLAQETIIRPGVEPVAVDVFCVEHGRWANRGAQQTAALAASFSYDADSLDDDAALVSLAEQAGSNGFLAGKGQLNKAGRLAVQASKNQQEVWNRVASTNALSTVISETGAFTSNYADLDVLAGLEPYIVQFKQPIDQHERVVGVIVAINGHVESIDVFESTPLFRKLWPKLLKGYALDAANYADEDGAITPVSLADAQRFYDDMVSANVKTEESGANMAVANRESQTVVGFSLHEHGAIGENDAVGGPPVRGMMGGGMMGGMGGFGGVHAAGFSK